MEAVAEVTLENRLHRRAHNKDKQRFRAPQLRDRVQVPLAGPAAG